jgi:hypothetical protein
MGQHNANDACVAYAPDTPMAGRTLTAKAAMLEALGTAVCVQRNQLPEVDDFGRPALRIDRYRSAA